MLYFAFFWASCKLHCPFVPVNFCVMLTNQSYPKNMFVPFKSVTIMSIFSVCPLISSSSSTNLVTSPFLVLSALKILNNQSISSVLICFFFTSCLSILVWVYSELTNILSCNFFLFDIFIFVHTLSSLSSLSLLYRITYWFFRDLLYTEVHCTIPTLSFQWDLPFCCCCHIPNSETCPRYVQLQYDIKFLQLFGFICVQKSISSLILYNRLNSIKFLWLFGFIWVKIHSYLYLFPLSNYLLLKLHKLLGLYIEFSPFQSELLFTVLCCGNH